LFDKDTGAIGTRADLRVHYSTDNMPSAERKNRRIRKATERVQKLARPYALPVDAKGKLEPSEYVAKVSEQIIAQQRRRKQRRRTYNRALRLFEYIQEEVRNGTTQFLSAFWKRSKYGTKAGIRVVREHTTKPIVAVVKEAVNVLSPAYKEPTECAVFSDVNLGIITHITEPLSGEAIRKLQIKEASLDIEGWHDNGEIQIVLYKGQPTKVVAYDLEICRALKVGDSSGRPLELMLIRQQRMDEILLERHRGKAQVQQQSVNSRIWADNHSTKIEIEEPETDKGWVPFAKWWASAKSNRNRKAK